MISWPTLTLSLRRRRFGVLAGCIFAMVGFILFVARGQFAGAQPDAWGQVQKTGILRVGIDASYPPFADLDSQGQIIGLDADLARLLGPAVGARQVELLNMGYDGLYDALRVGQVDALVSALVVDPSRWEDVGYSISYFDAGQVFVLPVGATKPVQMEDLAGIRLAVELGSEGDVLARQQTRRVSGLQILARPSAEEALAAVADHQADAGLVDGVTARAYHRQHPGVQIAGPPVSHELYVVAVRRRSTALLEAIDRVLIQMREDGSLDELIDRWVGK